MSLLVGTAVDQINQELNIIGQQVDSSDIFLYLMRAVNYFSTSYAFPTAKKTFNALFFNGVREIGVPSDFGTLGEPQRFPALHSPRFLNQTGRELTHWPYGRKISVQYDNSTPFLDVVDNMDSDATLFSGCETTTGITISGDGSGLALDNMIYTEGLGSMKFTVTASSGQTILTFALDATYDITDMLTKNWVFLDLISPSTNTVAFSSIKLRLGNDSTHYHEMSATTRYRGNTILTGFGQIGFDLTSRTDTGTVTDTAIDYMQVVLNHGTTGVDGTYHLDNIFTAQGVYFQIPYYSIYNILGAGTTPQNTISLTTDVIMLPVQCDEAIIYKTLELIAGSPNIADQNFANFCARELKPKEDLLMSLYPSERILVQSQWYKRQNSRRRSYGRNDFYYYP